MLFGDSLVDVDAIDFTGGVGLKDERTRIWTGGREEAFYLSVKGKGAFDEWARLRDIGKSNQALSSVIERVKYVREYESKRDSVGAFLQSIEGALALCLKDPDNTLELIYVAARAIACLQQFGLDA